MTGMSALLALTRCGTWSFWVPIGHSAGEVLPQDSSNGVLLKPITREYVVELQPAGWERGSMRFAVSRKLKTAVVHAQGQDESLTYYVIRRDACAAASSEFVMRS